MMLMVFVLVNICIACDDDDKNVYDRDNDNGVVEITIGTIDSGTSRD